MQAGIFLMVAAVAGFAGYYFNHAKLNSPQIEVAAQTLIAGIVRRIELKAAEPVDIARQSPGGELLGDLVRSLPGGDPGAK